jgi:hypothetical protein
MTDNQPKILQDKFITNRQKKMSNTKKLLNKRYDKVPLTFQLLKK